MTVMQLLVSVCGVLLAIVGFGGRSLITRMIDSLDGMSIRIEKLDERLTAISQLNALEIEKIHSKIAILDRQCAWTHREDRRRGDAA